MEKINLNRADKKIAIGVCISSEPECQMAPLSNPVIQWGGKYKNA